MRHFDLWIKKFNLRKAQISEVLSEHQKSVESLKGRIPCAEVFAPLKEFDGSGRKSMCFVDGGEGYRELLGAGLYFVRASSLFMSEEVGERFVRDLDLGVISYDDNTKDRVELLREALEFEVALKTITEYNPAYVFLDGSLYVKSSRKQIECREYSGYAQKFGELVDCARDAGACLVGVSEDTKSRLFKHYLSSRYGVAFPEYFTDPTILSMLSPYVRYRTITLSPKSNGVVYPTAYMNVNELSSPLRVDVLQDDGRFGEVLSLILYLSRGSKRFGYPLPLYLAHLDARIRPKHADWSARQLKHYSLKENPCLGGALFRERRREIRPDN